MSDKLQVVIIDDHPLFREGIVSTLQAEPDIEIIGQGTTAEDAKRLACELFPDILLLDINIPGGGLNALESIAATCPVVKVCMLTASEEEDDVVAALRRGARAYAVKGVSARELVRIVRAVCEGEVYVTPGLAAILLAEKNSVVHDTGQPASPLDELTKREQQVLELLAAGHSNKEIGGQLYLSEKTVKHYMTNILQKLQVRNRVEAALLAQKASSTPKHSAPQRRP